MCVTNGKIGEMGKLGNLWRINLLWSYEKPYVEFFFFLLLKRKSPCYEIFFLKYSLFFYDMKYLFLHFRIFSVYGLRLPFHQQFDN